MARFRRSSREKTRLIPLTELTSEALHREVIGNTALTLHAALQAGLPVLEAWVLPADAFREIVHGALPAAHDPASLISVIHRPAGIERAARARERLGVAALDESLVTELAALARTPPDGARWGYTLRASPTMRDDSVARMAGLDVVIEGVRGAADLERALRSIWASCFDETTLRYLRSRRVRDLALAVLVQRLEPVSASGVLLVSDPRQRHAIVDDSDTGPGSGQPPGDSQRLSVASVALGLGVQALDGGGRDLVRFDVGGKLVEQRVAPKSTKIVVGARGVEVVAVEGDAVHRPAVVDRQLGELAAIAVGLDALDRGPDTAAFVVARRGGVLLSDAWRSDGLGFPEGGTAATVWSRVGLGESLPGVPTPLTASLASAFEERGLREALAALGCKPDRGLPLVTRVHGRYYVSLTALMPALAEVPGIDPVALVELLDKDGAEQLAVDLKLERRSSSLARLPITTARLLALQRRLGDDVQRFEREADQQRRWLAELDLGILPDDSLKTTLLETHRFFQRTARLLLRCGIAALAAHVGLKTVLARSTPVGAERVAQIISSGVGDIATVGPGVALCHVSAIVDRDREAQPLLFGQKLRELSALPLGPGRRAIQQYLEAYGDRGAREVELSAQRYGEDPAPLLAMVSALLRAGPIDPDRTLSHARVAADRELAALEARIPYVEKVLIKALVTRARELTRLRENMRVWLARTLAMLRGVVLDVDRRLARLDASLTAGDAFFCTFEELVSAVGSSRVDLGPIARMRRAGWQRDARAGEPPQSFVGAPPPIALPPLGTVVLHGAPCSAGVVTGRARYLGPAGEGAEAIESGDVIVTRALDIGFAPLFFTAGAIVAELGGPLSHGAVAARECGLPAVLGVPAATSTVQDGETLRVDGDRGVVERLDA